MSEHSLIVHSTPKTPALSKVSTALRLSERLLPSTPTEQDWAWWHSLDDVWKNIFTAHIYHWDKVYSDEFFWDNCHLIDEYGIVNLADHADLTKILQLKNIDAVGFDFWAWEYLIETKPLVRLMQLTKLNLCANKIQDISSLENLTKLTKLTLSSNQIKDINPLANLTKLTMLFLGGSNPWDNPIPPSQIDWLEQQLPYCKISFN